MPHHLTSLFQFYYANYGGTVARGFLHRAALYVSSKELSQEEINRVQRMTADSNEDALFTEPLDECYPNEPSRSFKMLENGEAAISVDEYNAIKKGDLRIYLFIVLKYRDRSMPRSVIGVTEKCGWFQGDFLSLHNCGVNRSFLKIAKDRP